MRTTIQAHAGQGFPEMGEPCPDVSVPSGADVLDPRTRRSLRLVTSPAGEALRELVEVAGAGDPDAFRELFERYSTPIFRYAWARLGDRELAEDATQNAFIVAWSKLPEFRYEHDGSFVAWLFAIARRVVAEGLRREGNVIWLPLGGADRAVQGMEDAIVDSASAMDRLSRLPDGQLEVVVLRFVVGLSVAEVALTIGKSEGRVKELQHRGLSRLRRDEARGDLA